MKKSGGNYRRGVSAYWAEDYLTAHRLLLGFAEKGDPAAQTMIGSIYQLGFGGFEINDEEATKWYLLASENGDGVAANNLGTMAFQRGDHKRAAELYEKARCQGFPHSPRDLSTYEKGRG